MLAGIIVLGFSAGSDAGKSTGAGFSGLSSEPSAAAPKESYARLQSPAGQLHSDIPRRRAKSRSSNRMDHAEVAIRNGGSSGGRAKRVMVGGQKLALSVVDVNAIPFAVLKKRAGVFNGAIGARIEADFAANITQLTGCNAGSRVYAYGPSTDKPVGLALVLNCG